MPKATNAAKGRPTHPDAHPSPVPDPARAVPVEEEAFLHRTLPGRQKFARNFLAGKAPGIQQRYAPNAQVSGNEGWVEDEETIDRLVKWREEATH